jgi:endoplasmic reticulum Man9GlcNAc2 1,2-alpha-mannosidase
VPPRVEELSDVGRRDWTTGIELIRTCMATHDTKTYVPRRGFGHSIDICAVDSHRKLHISGSPVIIWKLFKVFPVTGTSRAHGAGQGYYPQGVCLYTLTASENIHPMMLDTCSGTSLSLFPTFFVLIGRLKRPETVESLFIAFRLTGDKRYRDYGWDIFQAIEKHCRIPGGGYATIVNVDDVPVQHEDKMETFFLVSFFFPSRFRICLGWGWE